MTRSVRNAWGEYQNCPDRAGRDAAARLELRRNVATCLPDMGKTKARRHLRTLTAATEKRRSKMVLAFCADSHIV